MDKRIAVLGAGAIGGTVGADLTKAGHDVLLIDQWPAHVEAMNAHGLRFTMLRTGEEFRVRVKAIHLCELAGLKPQFDLVFLACKTYDSCWMARLVQPYLKSDGALVPLQNGMTDEFITPIIGTERDIPCAIEVAADISEPGWIWRNMPRDGCHLAFGELDGKVTPRVKEVAQIMSVVAITEVKTNILGAKWSKLVRSTSGMPGMAIFGTSMKEMLENPKYLRFTIKLGSETARVGTALGYVLEPVFGLTAADFNCTVEEKVEKLMKQAVSGVAKEGAEGSRGFRRTTVMRDLENGRRTETGDLNGYVVSKGQQVKVPTPVNEAINNLMNEIEQGKREFRSRSNLEAVQRYM